MIARFQSFRFDFNAFLYLNLLHYNDECYQLFLGGGFHLTTSLWFFFSRFPEAFVYFLFALSRSMMSIILLFEES